MNIKFRVWCKDHNEWEKNPIFLDESGMPWHFIRGELKAIRPDSHIVQLSTGVFDRNGKEIYEGDVVRRYAKATFFKFGGREIMGMPGEFVKEVYNDIEVKHYKTGFNSFNEYYEIGITKQIGCEVIGNIFENPELLKNNV